MDLNELVGQLLFGGPSQNGEPDVMDGSSPGNGKSVGEGSGEEAGDNKERKKNPGKTRKPTRPRIAFQTRSADDVLDDGYRWRKYGQKAVKNSAYPRCVFNIDRPDLSTDIIPDIDRSGMHDNFSNEYFFDS